MIESTAFLRNLPRCLLVENRLRSEAVITACDVIDFSFQALSNTLLGISLRDLPDVTHTERIQTALYCWSIVDHFYAFCKLTKAWEALPQNEYLRACVPVASKMRNVMDHLSENLGNEGRRKGDTHTLHGSVLFACGVTKENYQDYIFFSLGGPHQDSHVSPIIDTQHPISVSGISNIVFAAFGEELNLSLLLANLKLAIKEFDSLSERGTTENIRAFARENGVDAEELLKDRISGTVKARMRIPVS